MKVTILSVACLAALTISAPAPAPEADPKAFLNLGAVAIPAITGSALIDGLLLGKVAFLKAAILANLLLGSESADEADCRSSGLCDSYGAPVETYGAPVQDSYGAPAPSYEEPAPAYSAPAYEAPADTYGSPEAPPVVETYGAPAADPLPAYNGRY